MSQIDPTPPFRSPDGTLESRRRASLMSRALTDQKYQHTGPRAGCPRQSSTEGMVAYQKAGRVRTYAVAPRRSKRGIQ